MVSPAGLFCIAVSRSPCQLPSCTCRALCQPRCPAPVGRCQLRTVAHAGSCYGVTVLESWADSVDQSLVLCMVRRLCVERTGSYGATRDRSAARHVAGGLALWRRREPGPGPASRGARARTNLNFNSAVDGVMHAKTHSRRMRARGRAAARGCADRMRARIPNRVRYNTTFSYLERASNRRWLPVFLLVF